MIFWIFAAALALGTGGVLGLFVLRARDGAAPAADHDLRVYRDQLAEVDRDLARGVIPADDAERLRTEISRRILAADARSRTSDGAGAAPRRRGTVLAVAALAVLAGGSVLLYRELGVPGYGDVPRAGRLAASEEARRDRLSQQAAEARLPPADAAPETGAGAEFLALMERLRETVAERPDDLQGLALLARYEAALGNLGAAHRAQARLIAAKGGEATAADFAHLADLMVSAAGGYVSTEAEAALRAALDRDPREPRARFYLGLYLIQVDRPDAALRMWDQLLRESRADAPWVPVIRGQIEELAYRAGQSRYQPPPVPDAPAPTREEIDAAAGMSDAARAEMITDMVARLSERLASEGGTPEEWARLITAYGVLGDTEQAGAIWSEAQEVFAATPDALAPIRAAARDAGLVE